MFPTAKLTKRQKKGIAFRERKQAKSKGVALDKLEDVPSLEDQVLVDATQGSQGCQVSTEALVGKARPEGEEIKAWGMVVAARKGKRKVDKEEGALGESDQPKAKRRRGFNGSPLDSMAESIDVHGEPGQRFILFLGNLKYTTTKEAIQAHFSICVPPPTVRLLTPKPSTTSATKPVTKSKGCAFLEFERRDALQQGLKLHHSQLDGRQINVELTAGGGGKGATRMKKLKERNKELEGQRVGQISIVDVLQLIRHSQRKRQVGTNSEGTQRFSATSGAEQSHTHKRTWTIGDTEEKGTHRGGRKHQRGSRKRGNLAKDFRTGVNAIPIG